MHFGGCLCKVSLPRRRGDPLIQRLGIKCNIIHFWHVLPCFD